MGNVQDSRTTRLLTYSVNGGAPVPLTIGFDRSGFGDGRRLAANGDFNADISISQLSPGINQVNLTATGNRNLESTEVVSVNYEAGSSILPYAINWQTVGDPQNVGQYVDGHWGHSELGLRTTQSGYDRLFLIGERTWTDYEVSLRFAVHELERTTGPFSGPNGVGIIMRFAGHVTGGHRNFPHAQPKRGYQPFGAIAWLRWRAGVGRQPVREFYRGDNDSAIDHGSFDFAIASWYRMTVRCETLADSSLGHGVTRYSFKIWNESDAEPLTWDWQEIQQSEHALRQGGVALVAHHADVTFGDVSIMPISNTPSD